MSEEKIVYNCAIYGRSSDEETMSKDYNSTEQQGHICRRLAKGKSLSTGIEHRITYELIEKRAMSGGTDDRPEYQKLLKKIRKGEVQAIFAKELSRLSRNLGDFCKLLDICKKHKVGIYMEGLDYEPGNPFSDLIMKIFAVIAEFERQLIKERTSSSIRSRTLNNAIIHGGNVVIGFDKVEGKTGVWKVNKREQKILHHVMEIFLQSSNYTQAVKKINELGYKSKKGKEFTGSYLKGTLQNKKYIGMLKVPQDEDDKSPPIYVDLPTGEVVPRELFEKVQAKVEKLLTEGNTKRKGKNRDYPLSG
jgi:site-specific DNA recombinase